MAAPPSRIPVRAGGRNLPQAGSSTVAADEMMDMLIKIKEAMRVPEHAERKIKALDSIIAGLRRNRAQLEKEIQADEALLAQIAVKEAEILSKRTKLQASHDALAAAARDIRDKLDLANTHVAATTSTAKRTTATTVYTFQERNANYISSTLTAARGYSCKPEDAPHRTMKLGGSMRGGSTLSSTGLGIATATATGRSTAGSMAASMASAGR